MNKNFSKCILSTHYSFSNPVSFHHNKNFSTHEAENYTTQSSMLPKKKVRNKITTIKVETGTTF